MNIRLLTVALAMTMCVSIFHAHEAFAQAGTSSSSFGITRAGLHRSSPNGQFMMPMPDMIRVEEFINYHRHDLPLPDQGRRVRLNIQSMLLPAKGSKKSETKKGHKDQAGKTVLQIGLTTPRATDSKTLPPLNLVLVIDRSGSMSGQRLADVKEAIKAMVENFRATDQITLVSFSNDAVVNLEACEKTNQQTICSVVDGIQAGGGTNLHAGLMLGFKQALKHFDRERANRIVFLTDGNANVGVTESTEIAEQSKRCMDDGISMATIGLGVDFNHGLLRELADSGRGVMHFVGDSKDIKKTFVDEFDSVLAPAASKVRLTVDFDGDIKPKFYGYSPKSKPNGKHVFQLDDLGHGVTQVVMVRLPKTNNKLKGTVRLSYVDAITGEKVEVAQSLAELNRQNKQSLKRNYAIALIAQSIHRAAESSNKGDPLKAIKNLESGIQKAKKTLSGSDKHVARVLKIAKSYRSKLKESLKTQEHQNRSNIK